MQHGAPDMVPAAFGKGGGLYAQDLQEGREVNPHHQLRGSFPRRGKRTAALSMPGRKEDTKRHYAKRTDVRIIKASNQNRC